MTMKFKKKKLSLDIIFRLCSGYANALLHESSLSLKVPRSFLQSSLPTIQLDDTIQTAVIFVDQMKRETLSTEAKFLSLSENLLRKFVFT